MANQFNSETQLHYDTSVDFYKEFLDPYLKYTSGLFKESSCDLPTAIKAMLDLHLNFLDQSQVSSPKILEIGCGWGAFLRRLIESGRPFDYCAVNPSPVQNEHIKKEVSNCYQIFESAFETLDLHVFGDERPFDVIYLIGSFCHLKDKAKQLSRLNEVLAPNGRIIVEDTFFISDQHYKDHAARQETKFVQQTVFGYAHILSLPNFVNVASECGLVMEQMLEHSDSYCKTVAAWIETLKSLDQTQYPMANTYVDYLKIGQRGWNYTIANYLLSLKKGGTKNLRSQSAGGPS